MTSEIIEANLKLFPGVHHHQLQVDFKEVYILCSVYISGGWAIWWIEEFTSAHHKVQGRTIGNIF